MRVIGVVVLLFGVGFGAITTASAAFRAMASTYFETGSQMWSPNGQAVVFARGSKTNILNTELYIMDTTTGHVQQMTNDGAFLQSPTWSPDGTQIAMLWTPERGGSAEIITLPAEGGAQRQITQDGLHKTQPVWSPDGTRIAYFATDFDARYELWITDLNGSTRLLTSDVQYPYDFPSAWAGERIAVPLQQTTAIFDTVSGTLRKELPVWSREFAWSPDGTQLALFLGVDQGEYARGVYLWDSTADTFESLVTRGGDVIDLNWSDESLYYMVFGGAGGFTGRRVYRRDLETREAHQLTDQGHEFNEFMQVSPDGTRIVFGGRYALHVMDARNGTVALQYDPYLSAEHNARQISLFSIVIGGLLVMLPGLVGGKRL